MQTVYTRNGNVIAARPNWSRPVTESFEYRTEIFAAEDGTERRHAHRTMPRISVQYLADALDGAARRLFEDYVRPAEDRSYAVPVRWRSFPLPADLPALSIVTTQPGTRPWWLQAGCALVIEAGDTQEVVNVETVADGAGEFTLTFAETTSSAFAAGALVMLAYWSHYTAGPTFSHIIREHRQHQADFLASPSRLPEWTIPDGTPPIFKGYEILALRHNWRGALGSDLDDRREVLDFARGVQDIQWYHRHRIQIENRRSTALSREAADNLLHTFMRHRGMRTPFWTTPLTIEFPDIIPARSGGGVLFFEGTRYTELYHGDPIFTHIWFEWPDGAVQISRITGKSNQFGDDFVQLEDDLERPVTDDTVVRWAVLARFGSDRLQLDWLTDEACEAQVPIRFLRSDWVDEEDLVYPVEITRLTADLADPADWSQAEQYTEIAFATSGVNLDLIEAGRGSLDWWWRAQTPPTRPTNWIARLDVAFYDATGTQISTHSDTGRQSKASDSAVVTVEIDGTLAIPATAMSARVRLVMTRDFEKLDRNYAAVRHREWAPARSGENIKWL